MFRVGEFSRIARVSARLLRFYDEIGLFAPAHADPHTGYRYYSVDQLPQLNRILVLKDLGFNLDQVREIVGSGIDAAGLRNLLLLRRNDVEQALAVEAQRLRYLESRIAQLEAEGGLSVDDVVVRSEPGHRLLSLRRTVPSFAAAREMIGELHGQARRLLPKGRQPTLMAVAHSAEFEQDEIDVEFGYALPAGCEVHLPENGGLRLREVEAVERMAVCVRIGLPEHAHLVSAKIGRFLEASGDRLAGPSREVLLQPPDPARMHESVVEMQYPIEPRGSR
jgi:DNA-binding transcriptional MerR regulator